MGEPKTYQIIRRLVYVKAGYDCTGHGRLDADTFRIYRNLERLVDDTTDKYDVAFTGLCRKLEHRPDVINRDDQEASRQLNEFRTIGGGLFEGGCKTWGRVISLIALTCKIVVNRVARGEGEKAVGDIAKVFSAYLDEVCEPDMRCLGGWDALERVFPDPDLQQAKTLKWFVGSVVVLGLSSLQMIMAN